MHLKSSNVWQRSQRVREISLYILPNSRVFVNQPSTVYALAVDTAVQTVYYYATLYVLLHGGGGLLAACPRPSQAERTTNPS